VDGLLRLALDGFDGAIILGRHGCGFGTYLWDEVTG
jgi:hypothetical protein